MDVELDGQRASFTERARMTGGGLGLGALLLFFLQNLQDAQIHFLWFDWEIGVVWALLASALAGALASFAFTSLRGRRSRNPG